MLVTTFDCLRQNFDIGLIFGILVPEAHVKRYRILVTKTAKRSPTSQSCHQHPSPTSMKPRKYLKKTQNSITEIGCVNSFDFRSIEFLADRLLLWTFVNINSSFCDVPSNLLKLLIYFSGYIDVGDRCWRCCVGDNFEILVT